MIRGILQIFFEKIQEAFSGEKTSLEDVSSKTISPATPPKTTSPEVTKVPAESLSLAEQLRIEIARDAAYLYAFKTGEATTIPAGMICSNHVGKNGDVDYIILATGDPKALSSGSTDGYSICLPEHIEATASGHHITVRVIARASGSDQSCFAVAYSTNDVGNSGWHWFTTSTEWSIYTMEFNVPVMKDGNGDFVGILPDSEGKPASEFCYLAISISE